MNTTHNTALHSLNDKGCEQLIRATLVCELMADLMSNQGNSNQKMVSALGVAALFECLAAQMDGAIDNSGLFNAARTQGKDNAIN